ncbi:DUF262 domain-containing HNH endonuclease family protein [Lactiplantibacillus paraxiangfangensis]|uniref:DUF262 domain-containing protein n=1 Tax=Lactiplantibacillus paraxiangfangensis TaxID=3076224 RepID=UPI0030C6862C
MSYTELVKSETQSLDTYLKLNVDRTFLIPFSQRNYEWGKPEVERLFNDLTSLYSSNKEYHMLNFFTLYHDDNNNLRIFDGQQRTVTCMLILAVIAQNLLKQGDKDAAKQIRQSFFVQHDALRTNSKIQKKLAFDSDADNTFFYRVTDNKFNYIINNSEELNSNQKAIYYNLLYINHLFEVFSNTYKDLDLTKLAGFILDKTLLVEFDAYKEDIALNMFESLNNTGKNIEKYYVLKNDMVKCLGESVVKPKWKEIDSALSGLNHKSFLIATATLFKGKTSENKILEHLYSGKDVNDKTDMDQLLELLLQASKCFLKICNENQMTDSNNRDLSKYKDYVNTIHLFSMKQHRPIILAMLLRKKGLKEVNAVLKAIIELTIKNFYFGEQKANTIETKFATYAKGVYSSELDIDSLIKQIRNLCISDNQLIESIKQKQFPQNNSKISFILRSVYNYEYRNNELEVSSSGNDVEHILPQTPKEDSQWLKWYPEEEERNKYTYNIGNLTLWHSKDNRSAKNAEFNDKSKKYAQSGLKENRNISKNDKWTSSEIRNRAEHMANIICTIFNEDYAKIE